MRRPDGLHHSQQRFGMYRWHVVDPIHFRDDLRVDIRALGWMSGGRHRLLTDDVASTALYYLDRPTSAHPALPSNDDLEVVGARWLRAPGAVLTGSRRARSSLAH